MNIFKDYKMKKVAAIIFCICVGVLLVLCIGYVNSPVNSVPVEMTTHEDSFSAKGFIVRDEKVYYARNTGTMYNHVSEGARVSKDMLITTVYSGVIGDDTIKELGTIDRKIEKEINTENKTSLYVDDESSVENAIVDRSNNIFDAARNKNVTEIGAYKDEINRLRSGEGIDKENRLQELYSQKQAIEARIGQNKSEIFTEISGIFTSYLDGLESVMNPAKIKDYTVSYIEGLYGTYDTYGNRSTSVKTGDPICKVVNNHVWYVLVTADADRLAETELGSAVTVRFKNMTDSEAKGTISYISDVQEDNKVLLLIKCSEYFENAFAYREADVDIIFHRYEGYKVPVQAIHTDNGKHSVVGVMGNKQCNCDCEIVYSDAEEGIVIIKSTDNAQNKLSKMDKIIVGER